MMLGTINWDTVQTAAVTTGVTLLLTALFGLLWKVLRWDTIKRAVAVTLRERAEFIVWEVFSLGGPLALAVGCKLATKHLLLRLILISFLGSVISVRYLNCLRRCIFIADRHFLRQLRRREEMTDDQMAEYVNAELRRDIRALNWDFTLTSSCALGSLSAFLID
jgi:hypothetical protein